MNRQVQWIRFFCLAGLIGHSQFETKPVHPEGPGMQGTKKIKQLSGRLFSWNIYNKVLPWNQNSVARSTMEFIC